MAGTIGVCGAWKLKVDRSAPPAKHGREAQLFGIRSASHAYAGVPVLQDVSAELRAGSVVGLIGQNGAGKSTLIRILSGALQPLRGRPYLDSVEIKLSSPAEARHLGIAVVHQDVQLFPHLDVARNVYVVRGHLPRRRWLKTVNWPEVEETVERQLRSLGISIPCDRLAGQLDAAEQKLLEIARVTMLRPRFLILDEPTASLEPQASRRILDLILALRSQGMGICFVSHRLQEVREVSDEILILRDGHLVARRNRSAPEIELAELMLGGRAMRHQNERRHVLSADRAPAVEISGLSLNDRDVISLTVRKGEIFGLTGLMGSGAERIVRWLGGDEPLQSLIRIDGKPARLKKPADAIRHGIGFVAEDRKRKGIVPRQSVAVNISLASLRDVGRAAGLVSWTRLGKRAEHYRSALGIQLSSVESPVVSLSGGNQQKVLIARCLASGAKILCLEEPTHGVDIGAKAVIHDLLRRFASSGGTIVVASSDVGELTELCDRIAIFRHGALVAVAATDATSGADVILAGVRDPESVVKQLMADELTSSSVAQN